MPSISEITRWDTSQLSTAAASLTDSVSVLQRAMDGAGHDSQRTFETWSGPAAEAAAGRVAADRAAGGHVAAAVLRCVGALDGAARALGGAKSSAVTLVGESTRAGMTVLDDGRVVAPRLPGVSVETAAAQCALDEKANELGARLIMVLDTARQLDDKYAAMIRYSIGAMSATGSDVRRAGAMSQPVVAIVDGNAFLPTDPTEFADFWDGLSVEDRDALAAWDPTIGNRPGMPAMDKDRYNREYLDDLRAGVRPQLDVLNSAHPDWSEGKNIPPFVPFATNEGWENDSLGRDYRKYLDWSAARDPLVQQLSGYDNVAAQLTRSGGGGLAETYLMNIDNDGHAAVALNNPDSAANVATFVPGTGEGLGSIGTGIDRSQAMLDAAGTENTSVIAWYGYDAPPDIMGAARDDYADGAAEPLGAFQDGLRASHDGLPSHNTVIGHSYGTTAVAAAAENGHTLNADSVIFVASPGVNATSVEDLSLTGVRAEEMGEHVFATVAKHDMIAYSYNTTHGIPPIAGDFGATVFESDPGTTGSVAHTSKAHGEYWDEGNQSLLNMARIITGRPLA